MAETLRELVVALSLDSSNFSRNMRSINQQIKETDSTFRLAGAFGAGRIADGGNNLGAKRLWALGTDGLSSGREQSGAGAGGRRTALGLSVIFGRKFWEGETASRLPCCVSTGEQSK